MIKYNSEQNRRCNDNFNIGTSFLMIWNKHNNKINWCTRWIWTNKKIQVQYGWQVTLFIISNLRTELSYLCYSKNQQTIEYFHSGTNWIWDFHKWKYDLILSWKHFGVYLNFLIRIIINKSTNVVHSFDTVKEEQWKFMIFFSYSEFWTHPFQSWYSCFLFNDISIHFCNRLYFLGFGFRRELYFFSWRRIQTIE